MQLLALSTWSWIGIAAAGWCAFSFTFALWLGRTIRASDRAMMHPPPRVRPDYRSGTQLTVASAEVHQLRRDRDATGSHR